ncbi:MAG: DUF2914 domain-containing protein [Candidatus Krumholzibacteriia bacterium]
MRYVLYGMLGLALICGTAAAQATAAGPLEVTEMAFGSGYDVQSRSLEGEATVFAADTPVVYCRTRIVGATEPTTVTHVWYRDGKTVAHVELAVGSGNWRTVSSKQLLPEWTGSWEVRVVDSAGNLLRAESFTIE